MRKTGFGVFTWDGAERRSMRYGSFTLQNNTYEGLDCAQSRLDSLLNFIGKKVRVTCIVNESRPSGHCGDMSLNIFPTQPKRGEVFDLGVGILSTQDLSWNTLPAIIIAPNDERDKFWMDPSILYQLHDQTVTVVFEETDANFSAPVLIDTSQLKQGMISLGNGEFQVFGNRETTIPPKVKKLEDGLFLLDWDYQYGERV